MKDSFEYSAAQSVMTDLASGTLSGSGVDRVTKTIGDLAGYWYDRAAFALLDPATPLYTTESWLPAGDQTAGALAWGNTTLLPGRVGHEYFMTRGHWHQKREKGELVICVSGEGTLILMDDERRTRIERLTPGSTHHVPGYTAHRTANTGSEVLRFLCAWEANCGHDYEEIRRSGFSRVLLEKDGTQQLTTRD